MIERCGRTVLTIDYGGGRKVRVTCSRPVGHDGTHVGREGHDGIIDEVPEGTVVLG